MENNEGPHRQRKGVTPVQYGESLSSRVRPHSNRDGVSQPEQHYQASSVDFESNPRGHRGPETYRGEQIGYGRYPTERPGESNYPGPAIHASNRGGNSFSQYPQHHKTATDFGRRERRSSSCKRRLNEHSPHPDRYRPCKRPRVSQGHASDNVPVAHQMINPSNSGGNNFPQQSRYRHSLSPRGRPHSNRDGVSQPEQNYQTSSVDVESNHRGHRGPETYRGEQIGRYRTERPGGSNHPGPAIHASNRGGNSFSQYPHHHKTATDFGRSERRSSSCKRRLNEHLSSPDRYRPCKRPRVSQGRASDGVPAAHQMINPSNSGANSFPQQSRYRQSSSPRGRRQNSSRGDVLQPDQHYRASSIDFESNPRGHRGAETYREAPISYCKRRLNEHSSSPDRYRPWKRPRVSQGHVSDHIQDL